MDTLINKKLIWSNIDNFMVNNHDVVIKKIEIDECVNFIKSNEDIILAEYDKKNKICKGLSYNSNNKNSQFYNKYSDTYEKKKNINYLDKLNIKAENMNDCKDKCDNDDTCIFADFNDNNNTCTASYIENDSNFNIYIKN